MNHINSENQEELRNDIEAAMASIEKKWGVGVRVEKMRHTDTRAEIKLSLAPVDHGTMLDRHAIAFKAVAPLLGIEPRCLGHKFILGDEEYVMRGYNARSKVKPFLADRVSDGNRCKFPAEVTKQLKWA